MGYLKDLEEQSKYRRWGLDPLYFPGESTKDLYWPVFKLQMTNMEFYKIKLLINYKTLLNFVFNKNEHSRGCKVKKQEN